MSEARAHPRDYRSSHLDEGPDYHAKFERHPYRAVLWDLEREILIDVLERRFSDLATVSLLDFACGTGRILSALETRVGETAGVDVSESMLAVAKQVLQSSKLYCCDLTRDGALDGRQFDVITAFRFFPNAQPSLRDEAMERLRGLLAPGGLLIFNDHLRCGSASLRLERMLRAVGLRRRKKPRHCMSDEEVRALVASHGLRIAESHYIGVVPVLKEKRPLLSPALLRRLEGAARRHPLLHRLAATRIDVCERDEASAAIA